MKALIFTVFGLYVLLASFIILFQRSFIFKNRSTLSVGPLPGVAEFVQISSEHNSKLEGWWIENKEAKITLLYCHGNAATLHDLKHVAALFKEYGLQTLLFDYRGFGASTFLNPTEESVAADARAAYDWLIHEKQVGPNQIVLWGHSLGAAIAARLANERTVAGLITEGAFTSIFDMARYTYPWLYIHPSFIQDPFEVTTYLAARSMPLLMLHAENDLAIPLTIGQKAFQFAAAPKEWMLLEKIGHNDFPSVEGRYRDAILAWMQKVLPS